MEGEERVNENENKNENEKPYTLWLRCYCRTFWRLENHEVHVSQDYLTSPEASEKPGRKGKMWPSAESEP
jgi:hypothetical protein